MWTMTLILTIYGWTAWPPSSMREVHQTITVPGFPNVEECRKGADAVWAPYLDVILRGRPHSAFDQYSGRALCTGGDTVIFQMPSQ